MLPLSALLTSLASRYAVGEIAEFAGVTSYYDAGTSQWAESNTWIPAGSLGSTVKASLRADYRYVAATDQRAFAAQATIDLCAAMPVAKTATIAAWAIATDSTGACKALVVNASGAKIVSIGQMGANLGGGGVNTLTSDGTTIYSWASAANGLGFACWTTTDGDTWSAATLTGQAAYSGVGSANIGARLGQTGLGPLGEIFQASSGGTPALCVAAWCGARHLLIGPSTGGMWIAQRSANGTTFGGDETTAILGGAALNYGLSGWWYRNGNNFFLALTSAAVVGGYILRKSADGGVTWGDATGAIGGRYRVNSTDPARVVCAPSAGTAMAFSTDSGQTWTARTAPFTTNANTTIFGRGATWVLCNGQTGVAYQTANDGATWTLLSQPVGMLAQMAAVYADANRWYALSMASNQIATATTLGTWTVRNIANAAHGSTYAHAPGNLVATDANTVMGGSLTNGVVLSTADGGVTWMWSAPSTSAVLTGVGASYYVANTVGTPLFLSALVGTTYAAAITAADITALGNAYRVSTATITPTRANARTFVRVA